MNVEEAIQTAIQYEKRVVQVYEEAARASQDPAGRKLFERFVEIEQGHQAIVQAEMNAVAGNGYWFDMPEISMEG